VPTARDGTDRLYYTVDEAEGTPRQYTGIAEDLKPVPFGLGGNLPLGEELPDGSTFHEVDTGRLAIWGNSAWYYQASEMEILREIHEVQRQQLETLTGIRQTLQDMHIEQN
jgi:hypothetical protein